MANAYPVVVRPTEPSFKPDREPGWQVRIGNNGKILTERASHKNTALDIARDVAQKQKRPGVVVYTEELDFQRFESNDRYWLASQWEDI